MLPHLAGLPHAAGEVLDTPQVGARGGPGVDAGLVTQPPHGRDRGAFRHRDHEVDHRRLERGLDPRPADPRYP